MSVHTATGLAIVASASMTVGLYFMKREAERLPSLGGGWRLSAWWAFFRDPWWLVGLALQISGFLLYLFTLHDAPLSIVHTALNGGIALFVILAVVGLGERVTPVEWVGVSVITLGLIALSLSLAAPATGQTSAHGIVPFSIALLVLVGLALVLDPTPHRAVGLSIAAGLSLGLGSVYAKAMAVAPSLGAAVENVYMLLTLAANMVGFALMQASFQAGRGVIVMPLSSGISNLVPIIGGVVLFSETLPSQGPAAVLRPLAFVLAVGGGALLAGFGDHTVPAAMRGAAPEGTSHDEAISSR